MAQESKAQTEVDSWQTLYPLYINKAKSIKQGRRIPKESACEKPGLREMCMVCQHYKLRIMPQPLKRHPKDWETRGRVKVQLKDAAGNFTHDEIHTKKQLMLLMGKMIPTLKSRTEPKAKTATAPSGAKKKRRKKKGRR